MRDFAKSFCRLKNFENAWGVFDNLIEKFRAEDFEEGKYVVLRDAMRVTWRFFVFFFAHLPQKNGVWV